MSAAACDLCEAELRGSDVVWVKDGYEIARCPECGLVQRRTRPAAGELADIYGPAYFAAEAGDASGQGYDDYLADAGRHRAQARRRLDLLERHGERGRLLDVGAAAGFFVAEARARGWEARGVDVSEEMAGWARRELGVPVDTGAFSEDAASAGSLAAVTMWDYLEHTLSPRRDLAAAGALLPRAGCSRSPPATSSRWSRVLRGAAGTC